MSEEAPNRAPGEAPRHQMTGSPTENAGYRREADAANHDPVGDRPSPKGRCVFARHLGDGRS